MLGIDMELVNPGDGNGTIEHEEELRNRRVRKKIKANEVPVDDNFRHIHGKECRCVNGTTCQICVTDQDLMGVPRTDFKIIDRMGGPIVDTLIIRLNRRVAIFFGFM